MWCGRRGAASSRAASTTVTIPLVTPTNDRRDFIKRATIAAAAATGLDAATGPIAGQLEAQAAQGAARAPNPARAFDPALVSALGDAVLPESLGAAGRARAVTAFVRWIDRYEPVAEEMHGYGYADIRYTPSDPAPGWVAQLAGLDLLARRVHRRGFARLGVPLRRAVIERALARVPATRLPSNPLTAPHVVIALLAHWAASSEATDLAYGARIVKGNCRPLAATARRPLPLAPEGGG